MGDQTILDRIQSKMKSVACILVLALFVLATQGMELERADKPTYIILSNPEEGADLPELDAKDFVRGSKRLLKEYEGRQALARFGESDCKSPAKWGYLAILGATVCYLEG